MQKNNENGSGYKDKTGTEATDNIIHAKVEQRVLEKEQAKAQELVRLIKQITAVYGFNLNTRVEIRNKESGILYK